MIHRLKSKKKSHLITYMAAAIVVGYFGWGFLFPKAAHEEHRREARPVKVNVRAMKAEDITADVRIYGTTRASYRVNLMARTAGVIDRIGRRKGTSARSGEEILRLKTDDREARVKAATAAKEKAEMEFQTSQKLIADDLISRVEYIQTEAAYKAASASLDQAKLELSYTSVRAPFDGVVENLLVEAGQYISGGGAAGTTLGTFIQLDPIKITAELPEKYISRVQPGARARVTLSDGTRLEARLTYLASSASETTRTFPLELTAANPGNRIPEGITADISFPLDRVRATKINASSYLTLDDTGAVGLKVLGADDVVGFYPIDLVREEADGIWVSGLPDAANVIVAGQEFVRVGDKAEPNFEE